MSEDVSIQPSDSTSTGEDVSVQPSDSTSTSNGIPVQPPESTSASEVVPVQSSDDTSMSEDLPAKVPEGTSANEVVPVELSESASEDVPAKAPVDTNTSNEVPVQPLESTSASKDIPVQPPTKPAKTGNRWLNIIKRVLVGVVMVLAVLGLLINVSELVAIWAAYGPARNGVITVSNTVTQALQTADKGLTRVNGYVQTARQTLTQVNTDATQLGDHVKANSPLVTALSQRVDTKLSPIIENVQSTAATIHDSVLKVNSALLAVNRFPGITVPTLNDQLSTVSDRAQQAESAVQDLRVTLANVKAGTVTKAETAVMQITSRIDAPLTRIQSLVNTYQAKGIQAQNRVTSTTNTILTWLLVSAISLTLLIIIISAGLVLLIYICWQYIRHGRFPSLRVVYD